GAEGDVVRAAANQDGIEHVPQVRVHHHDLARQEADNVKQRLAALTAADRRHQHLTQPEGRWRLANVDDIDHLIGRLTCRDGGGGWGATTRGGGWWGGGGRGGGPGKKKWRERFFQTEKAPRRKKGCPATTTSASTMRKVAMTACKLLVRYQVE